MVIVSVQQTSALNRTLQAGGLSASKASLVESEIAASGKTSVTASTRTPDIASVRGALNQRITQDVIAGKLTADDAAKIDKTLDEMQAARSSGPTAGAATTEASSAKAARGGGSKPGGGGGGGGGGSGSAAKVELSRIVTITGALKTTVITYTDNSTDTKTSVNTDPAPKTADAGADGADIPPGSIVDALA